MRSSRRLRRSGEIPTSEPRASIPGHFPLDQLDSTNALVLDYLRHPDRVARFYPHRPSLESVEKFSMSLSGNRRVRREALAEALAEQQARWGVRPDPARRLASGAVAVVAGQQAGFLTGPLLAVLKALTAVKIARHLVSQGIDAVPVFWIASEDHDRDEISWAGIVGREPQAHRLEIDFDGADRSPVGWLRLREGVIRVIDECFDALGSLEYGREAREVVDGAYRAGTTPVDAFATMMGRMFAPTELIFVDPLDPGFRALSEPVMAEAYSRAGDVSLAVNQRTARLQESGYAAQVRVDGDFTGFFSLDRGMREAILPGDPAPARLSPNALLRPWVQDQVLPTAASVAGPAEVAYFAQASAVYECLGTAMPPAFPRITATIVEPPAARALRKYGLDLADVHAGEEELRRRVAAVDHDVARFGDVRERIRESFEGLRPMVEGADATLGAALDTALRKVIYQSERLERRFIGAATRREAVRERAIRSMMNRLLPFGRPQERSLCAVPFLARYGLSLVPLLDRQLELDGSVHQVIEL
jgi:uncharacterized protein YllA (UPF0747 family)